MLSNFEREKNMSRMNMKLIFAVLLTALVSFVPSALAAIVPKVVVSGSSAMWQTMALGAYKGGACVAGGTAPCFHWTSATAGGPGKANLNDSRGPGFVDNGNTWIVWDSSAGPNVWIYENVDSVVGTRCYYAQPRCTINMPTAVAAGGGQIAPALWGADTNLPAAILSQLQGAGFRVNTGATDIRPEDGSYAECRANSAAGGGPDGLDGLGYNALNAAGICPTFASPLASKFVAGGIKGQNGGAANVVAFNIFTPGATDPFTKRAIVKGTTVSAGASPMVTFFHCIGGSGTAFCPSSTTVPILRTIEFEDEWGIFGGYECDMGAIVDLHLSPPFAGFDVYQREPLSGTMNTFEYTEMRMPNKQGVSQENNVLPGPQNPLHQNCNAPGTNNRNRSIGTGQLVKDVKNSTVDAIGYAFFSFGNFSSIADNSNFHYLKLMGKDPIWHIGSFDANGLTTAAIAPVDAGQNLSAAQLLPGSADVCGGAGFPCHEKSIWSTNGTGLSFPTLRSGQYPAWSVLRLVSNGTALANAKLLVAASQIFVVTSTPDYVPVAKVVVAGFTDPGLQLLRSHYLQSGVSPVNFNTSTGDLGGDEGGCILNNADQATGLVAWYNDNDGQAWIPSGIKNLISEAYSCVQRSVGD
jgi:hypothetical protein